jgi:hypothetical protein
MTLEDIVEQLHLSVRCCGDHLGRNITGGYTGDLMSDVIANGKPGNLWITMQIHVNIVAVAVLKELAGIIIVQGREPAEDTMSRAAAEQVPIVVSELPAFEIAGRLHALLAGGS